MKRISIIGMGALGLLYGSRIQDNAQEVCLDYVMDNDRADKLNNTPFFINGKEYHFNITSESGAKPCDLLIIAVKYTSLFNILDMIEKCIDENTIIISVMNGISSERIIGERYSYKHIIYTVAQGMDAMKFGNHLTYTKFGDLRLGITDKGNQKDLIKVTSFFDKINMPYVVEDDIMRRMWSKFMANVGINQTCMVYGQTYGQVLTKGESNRTFYAACREVLAVAAAEGVNLTEKDISDYVVILNTLDPNGTPSMGQDRINKKPSEVDMFAGTVMELGKKHRICVPTNEFLYEKAKEIESHYL